MIIDFYLGLLITLAEENITFYDFVNMQRYFKFYFDLLNILNTFLIFQMIMQIF